MWLCSSFIWSLSPISPFSLSPFSLSPFSLPLSLSLPLPLLSHHPILCTHTRMQATKKKLLMLKRPLVYLCLLPIRQVHTRELLLASRLYLSLSLSPTPLLSIKDVHHRLSPSHSLALGHTNTHKHNLSISISHSQSRSCSLCSGHPHHRPSHFLPRPLGLANTHVHTHTHVPTQSHAPIGTNLVHVQLKFINLPGLQKS